MKADEYDKLIEDPAKFVAETALPKACKNLETPRRAMATWVRLGMELSKSAGYAFQFGKIAAELGYPAIPMDWGYAPLDMIGDFLRGVENLILDIRRSPDKVKKVPEALVEPLINYSLSFKAMGAKYAMFPLLRIALYGTFNI